jgi:hypothetical protein
MILLENFGAEPITVKPSRLVCNNFACILSRKVTQMMMPGIPKFGKESHPERAKDKRDRFFTPPLSKCRVEFQIPNRILNTLCNDSGGSLGYC